MMNTSLHGNLPGHTGRPPRRFPSNTFLLPTVSSFIVNIPANRVPTFKEKGIFGGQRTAHRSNLAFHDTSRPG